MTQRWIVRVAVPGVTVAAVSLAHLFAAGQTASLFFGPHDDTTLIYLIRLAGFVLLLVAIAGKNFRRKKAG